MVITPITGKVCNIVDLNSDNDFGLSKPQE
jgi:hypothetical protein